MNAQSKPMPPKACPICQVAMQATRKDDDIVHRCERCSLVVTIKAAKADHAR